MAAVVARYFADMRQALGEMARVLRRGGHLVMKISDSHVRGIDVPTHALLIELAEQNGLRLLEQFTDEIRSRSLLTKRNWYSGIIAHDWILIFRR
jgi:ubiquinone/menaquinone biosynthesis C-methylase UbiE